MAFQALSESDIQHFITCGYVHVKEAFPREIALEAQRFLWDRLAETYPEYGLVKDSPETWAAAIEKDATAAFPGINLRTFYNEPEFKRCETERLAGAIEDLIGVERWALKHAPHNWGWWPINFAVGAAEPWEVPTAGWHWDGMNRSHRVTSPEQGLLVLPCFSDVASHGGGTLLAKGSHQVVARYLARFPEGKESGEAIRECAAEHPWLAELTGVIESGDNRQKFLDCPFTDDRGTELQVVETIAQAGDVILGHPFLFHAASQNHSGLPRFMCNRAAPLTAPMELERSNGDYSVLERSIRFALQIHH